MSDRDHPTMAEGGRKNGESKLKLACTEHATVAEKDTATAAQAALGPPESRHWPPKGRASAAAGRRGSAAPAKTFKSLHV